MKKRFVLSLLGVLCGMLLSFGCSGGGGTPVTPSNDSLAKPTGSIDSLPIIGGSTAGDVFYALGLMGAYELRVDPDTQKAELVSKRLPSLGQSWIVSGIGFFTVAPCSDCLRIK